MTFDAAYPVGEAAEILARRAVEGDIDAFEQLFKLHQKRIYNLIYRIVANEQDAADLTQEVFVRAYKSGHLLKNAKTFPAWLRTIAVNLCRDHFRRSGRTIRASSLDEPVSVDGEEMEREVEDWSSNPERELDKKELREAVQRALGSLSEEHRMVMVLHHIEGMSLKDIARELRVPPGTVMSRLARARDELKRKLGHYVLSSGD